MPGPGLFITGTGTGIGKTFVSRGLTVALRRRGLRVAAVKPLETGCDPDPADAIALARASGDTALAGAPGLYRCAPPLAPHAAVLAGEPPPPATDALVESIHRATQGADFRLVEGAGGLYVPIDEERDFSHLARALGQPLLLVAPDGLGVLSHTLSVALAARHAPPAPLPLHGVVLNRLPDRPVDASMDTNARVLSDRLGLPVSTFRATADDDHALADEAERSGLVDAVLPRR